MPPSKRSNKICKDVTEMIGETPLVYLNNVTKGLPAKIACKVEYMSPGCSVKDRIGFGLIDEAEKAGLIEPGRTILIEPTSGNTGIALAYVAAARGYKLILVMPAVISNERKCIARAYGAEVLLSDPKLGFVGLINKANELRDAIPNSYILNQVANPANPQQHYENTGPEIWDQSNGEVDICVFGTGTGGTLTGVGRYLKEKKPEVKMYAVEPFESSVINGCEKGPHLIQGIGMGIIPDNLDLTIVEEALRVRSDDAVEMAKRLAREEGLLVGISAGANVCGAIEIARRPENAGKLIVTLLPDFGERYLSTCLYKNIQEECAKMTHTTVDEDKKYLQDKFGFSLNT